MMTGRQARDVLTRSEINRHVLDGHASAGMESALTTLPELARALLQADFAAVTIMDEEGTVERMFYAGISDEQAAAMGAPPEGRGLLGHLGDDHHGVVRISKIADHPVSIGFPRHHPPMDALIGIQVGTEGGRKANLYVANGPGKPDFSEDDELKLAALAKYVRLALENARLYAEEIQLRNQAQSAERRLEAVIRSSLAGVVVVDARTGAVAYASSEARRLTGLDLRTGSRREIYEVPGLYRNEYGTALEPDDLPLQQAIARRRRIGPVEMLFARGDGRDVPALVSAAPVFDIHGDVDAGVAVFMDMSRVKELDRVKDDFLSMITHDLRSPIATIKGLNNAAAAACMAGNTDEVKSQLNSMDEELDYLTELVSNLLDMSRIEAGSDIFEFEICHMADIAQDVINRMRRSREGKDREIYMNVPASLPRLYADPGQVGRVLANLVSNALKYSDGMIQVTSLPVASRGTVRTEVRDFGPGIPPERHRDIFDKFARLKTGKSRGREGSGLGLAICKSIVESHHGEIGVDSTEGAGSTFWFELPAENSGT